MSPIEGSRSYRECISAVAPFINSFPTEYSDIKSVANTWYALAHIHHPRISTAFVAMQSPPSFFTWGISSRAIQLEFLQNTIRDSIERPTVFGLEDSLEESAGSSSSAPYDVIVDLRAGGFGASSESSALVKGRL